MEENLVTSSFDTDDEDEECSEPELVKGREEACLILLVPL